LPHYYNPNQARVPAGRNGGGQWTRQGGGPDAIVRPAFLGPLVPPAVRVVQTGIPALLALFAALSARNSPDQRAIITFKAREFLTDKDKKLNPDAVRFLDEEEVKKNCEKLEEVQKLTDKGAADVDKRPERLGPSNRGTQIHKYVEKEVNGREDPNFKAEPSFLKTMAEASPELKKQMQGAANKNQIDKITYGVKGSIRVDVLENVGDRKVCVYDIKTGRRGLSLPRMVEIAGTVAKRYGPESQIIVTEIRPRY